MKLIKVIFLGLMLFSIAIYAGELIDESTPPAPSSLTTDGQKNEGNSSNIVTEKKENVGLGRVEINYKNALEVRRQYIMPVLETIWSENVICTELKDDDTAFMELKNIDKRAEWPSKFIDFWDDDFTYDVEQVGTLTPDVEKQIQEKTEGHITFAYLNSPTIEAFLEINEKYPCTEAGAVALLKISNLLRRHDYLYTYSLSKTGMTPFEEEDIKLNKHIIDFYPDGWITENARKRITTYNSNLSTKDKILLIEKHIDYLEENKLLYNKYYEYINESSNIVKNHGYYTYGRLLKTYLDECEKAIDQNTTETGKVNIPTYAIEMHNKHYNLKKRQKEKYPKYYKDMRKLPRCYGLIKKHAPEHYKGDPPLREKK